MSLAEGKATPWTSPKYLTSNQISSFFITEDKGFCYVQKETMQSPLD